MKTLPKNIKFTPTQKRKARATFSKMVKKQLPPEKVGRYVDTLVEQSLRHFGGERAAAAAAILGSRRFGAYVKGKYAQALDAPLGDLMGKSSSIPVHGYLDTKMLSGANRLFASKKHLIYFNAGEKPTKPVRDLQKLCGGTSANIYSTRELLLDSSRSELTSKWGFNRKHQAMFVGLSHMSLTDIDSVFSFSGVGSSTREQQRVYGNTLNLNFQWTISNINKYLPVNVKIYILKQVSFAENTDQALSQATNLTISPPTQDQGAMPVYNQLTSFVSGTHKSSVDVDPRSNGVLSSDTFKSSFEVQKVFKKKLSAGDILEFNYKHSTGPGIRIDKLNGLWEDPDVVNTMPLTYVPLFEFSGPQVEAYQANDNNIRHVGTGPGAVSFEFRKGLYGVQRPLSYLSTDATTGGYEDSKFGIRVFDKSINKTKGTTSQIFNKDYSQIVPAGGTPLASEIVIPIMSDEVETDIGVRT